MLPSVLATTGHRWDKGQDLPLEERVLGTPTAWKAKEGEIVAVVMAQGVRREEEAGNSVIIVVLMSVVGYVGLGSWVGGSFFFKKKG